MLKKKLLLLLLVVLIIIFLQGSRYLSFLEKPVEIKILFSAMQAPLWEELIADFENEHKDIKIKMVQASDAGDVVRNIYTRKESNTKSESIYDLVYMDIIWVSEFAKKDKLVDLSNGKFFSRTELEEMKKDFLPKDWKGGWYGEKLYRIPFFSDVGLLYYNKDRLQELGYKPPHTFDDLMKISEDLQKLREKRPELWGFVWQGMQYEGLVAIFIEVLKAYKGFWINDKTFEVGLDKDKSFQAVKFLHDAIYDYKKKISPQEVITFTEIKSNSIFKENEAVFLRSWPGFWDEANKVDSKIQGNFDFVQGREENNQIPSCQGGWGLGIDSSSQHKKEALEAIRYFSSAAVQRKYALKTGNMPSRRSLFNDLQLVKKYNYYPRLLEISEKSVLRPSLENYSEITKILQKHLSNILKKTRITPEKIKEEMENAANETRSCLSKKPTEEC